MSLPRQFYSHLLIGQHHHSTFPGKPPPGCFRPKDNWDSTKKKYPKQAGFKKGEPFRGKFPQTALMIFWIMNQARAAAGAEPGVSGNSQSGCQIKTNTNKSTSTLKGYVLLTWQLIELLFKCPFWLYLIITLCKINISLLFHLLVAEMLL